LLSCGFVLQATVRRLNNVMAVRLLDVGALQAALQTLVACRQLASYNKLQGTIVRNMLKQRSTTSHAPKTDEGTSEASTAAHDAQAKPSEADYLIGTPSFRILTCAVPPFQTVQEWKCSVL
jgi:hypothetical protein